MPGQSSSLVKRELFLEGTVQPDREFLAHLALAVVGVGVVPETFVWSVMPETIEARLWMIISLDNEKLDQLTTALGKVSGITRIHVRFPGESILLDLPAIGGSP